MSCRRPTARVRGRAACPHAKSLGMWRRQRGSKLRTHMLCH